mmetsp:Transcript_27256/g.76845  ORF Transcript_27256/g.76845 Transcript_27256/m.76845 type:complete len:247 (+) Transcript_27256:432-1172(+)
MSIGLVSRPLRPEAWYRMMSCSEELPEVTMAGVRGRLCLCSCWRRAEIAVLPCMCLMFSSTKSRSKRFPSVMHNLTTSSPSSATSTCSPARDRARLRTLVLMGSSSTTRACFSRVDRCCPETVADGRRGAGGLRGGTGGTGQCCVLQVDRGEESGLWSILREVSSYGVGGPDDQPGTATSSPRSSSTTCLMLRMPSSVAAARASPSPASPSWAPPHCCRTTPSFSTSTSTATEDSCTISRTTRKLH